MKLEIKEGTKHGRPVIRCKAKIIKSQTLQIPRTLQKTWSTTFDPERSMYTREQIVAMFKTQARRWQLAHYRKIFGDQVPEAVQAELV